MSIAPCFLSALGWNERWAALLAEAGNEVAAGRVIRRNRGTATIATEHGALSLSVPPRIGSLVTGDWVAVSSGAIADILPRAGAIRRRGNDGTEQVLAANVDVVLLVCGIDRPVKAGRIQRGAIAAWEAGASPVVVLNKSDLGPTEALRKTATAENPGLDLLDVSTVTGAGIDELRRRIGGSTAMLLGESGAGKSSLLNALLEEQLVATGAVRSGDAKGRHTTTARELYVVPGTGVIIDTPGIRAFGLAADVQALTAAFDDVDELAQSCRFGDCRHGSEPGCAVRAAIDTGSLSPSRLEQFIRIKREIAGEALRSNPRERHRQERKFGRQVQEAQDFKRRG
ncbi:MAG: ribosome small subunit-dependent GTPase A [Actinomycetota bacterium]